MRLRTIRAAELPLCVAVVRNVDAEAVIGTLSPPTYSADHAPVDPAILKKALGSALKRVIAAEALVTRYDTIVGDGDCGVGLKRGAEAVLSLLEDPSSGLTDDAVTAVNRIVTVVENTMDGTSGAIYSIFLNALAHGLRAQDQGTPTPATVEVWANALKYSITALGKYTPAQPGDRTLIDALVPFCNTLVAAKDVHAAAKAAQDGTEATKSMKASLGRSVYVGGEAEWVGKVPDPGAYGLSELLTGLAEAL
ncbi:hypothetical protein KXX21_006825 [Aspergillus fumigatus]|nr:hypothetical protein KXX21_006825 [Aspergillus fumigatus]